MSSEIKHEIVIVIYLQEENKWAFYNNKKLELPNITIFNDNFTITESAIGFVKTLLNIDLRALKIDNIGFIDSIIEKERIISFGFLVQILPGTHIDSKLEFLSYDEIRNAISRISQNHFKLLRKSVGYISYIPIFTQLKST